MRNWPTPLQKRARIEIIPMIDVMMFLLVFFVLISVNVIPSLGIKIKQPSSSQAQTLSTPDTQVVVTLAQHGEVQVNGQTVSIETLGIAVRSHAQSKNAGISPSNDKITVIVNSDKGSQVQGLIDVMDALKAAGLSKVSLAAKQKQ